MTETQAPRPGKGDVIPAVKEEVEDDGVVHAIMPMGDDEDAWYYLVRWEEQYEGRTMLKLRFYQYPKPSSSYKHTMLSNGINIRDDGDIRTRLVKSAARQQGHDNEESARGTLWLED